MMKKKRILLIDDDHDIRHGASMRLNAAGYETLNACDGMQGVQQANDCHPDVILLDVRMPVMDGMATLDELKNNDQTSQIPVVMISASMADQHSALDAGARFFLKKPYQSNELLAAVGTAVS